jgi:hypothetical protein
MSTQFTKQTCSAQVMFETAAEPPSVMGKQCQFGRSQPMGRSHEPANSGLKPHVAQHLMVTAVLQFAGLAG